MKKLPAKILQIYPRWEPVSTGDSLLLKPESCSKPRLSIPANPRLCHTLVRLYQVFEAYNAIVAEINPLVICTNESLMALDAKLEVDDSSLFRTAKLIPKNHDRNESHLEKLGREIGVSYVELDGDIGIISSGAGLGMATMDIIGQRLRPANFLETGGAITEDLLYKTMDLVLTKKVSGRFSSIYTAASIRFTRAPKKSFAMSKSVLSAFRLSPKHWAINKRRAWDILRSGGVHVVTDVATEKAVAKLIEILETSSLTKE